MPRVRRSSTWDSARWWEVYQRYAEMFLDPDQIDVVDESKIPGCRP
jgi:hypothetical protein